MENLITTLQKRLDFVETYIQKATVSLKNAPAGKLRATKVKRSIHYYLTTPGACNGTYIKTKEAPLVHALAQKEYDQELIKRATKERNQLLSLLDLYQTVPMETALESMHAFKKPKINSYFLTDKEYVEAWQNQKFQQKDTPGDEDLLSDRGERMRSKSEVLIANALNKYSIPYHYEKPIVIDNKIIYPDFTVLNISRRQEYIWEHFGLMSDATYATNFALKYSRYLCNGFLPGENFLFTVEAESVKFGTRQIEAIIHQYLLS